MLIPIGTEVRTRRPPRANHALIIANALIFLLTDVLQFPIFREIKPLFMLDGAWPSPYQYITYQFLHGDSMHLIGNMLFLWIFGNAVCDRLGWRVYLMFYLAGGVFSGIVFTYVAENPIMGASGSIAAVTTAFLVLYPRVHITMLLYALMFLTFPDPGHVSDRFQDHPVGQCTGPVDFSGSGVKRCLFGASGRLCVWSDYRVDDAADSRRAAQSVRPARVMGPLESP
jgi:hypothetical protein